jgi:hypothetical protein
MKRVIAGTFMATAFAVGLSAQAPQATPMQEAKDANKTVTVTGCLKAGEGTDSFLLSNLKWKNKAVGTAGAVTPAPPAVAATSLKLVATPGAQLSDHLGHTVEVSGTVGDKADKDKDKVMADPAARPASPQASLHVTTLKMISATCSTE